MELVTICLWIEFCKHVFVTLYPTGTLLFSRVPQGFGWASTAKQWKNGLSRLRSPGAKEAEERHALLGTVGAAHTSIDFARNDQPEHTAYARVLCAGTSGLATNMNSSGNWVTTRLGIGFG